MKIIVLSLAFIIISPSVIQAQSSPNEKSTYSIVMQMGEPQKPVSTKEMTTPTRNLYLSVQLFSIIPTEGIKSFRGTPAPGAWLTGIGGMVGPAYTDDDQHFGVKVSPQLQDGKLITGIEVTPWDSADNLITARNFNVDLTDMKSTSVELARKPNGRVYLLSLSPSVDVQDDKPPKSIVDSNHLLENFFFNNSPVILNGEFFLGTMGGGGGNLAFIDIPGYFDVKFSLVQFKNATPSGELQDGVIRLTNESGKQLKIYNVACDVGASLPNGPYQVWAKWDAPKETLEQARQRELGSLEQARKEGRLNVPDEVINRLVKQMKAGKPFMMHRGMTSLRKDERM